MRQTIRMRLALWCAALLATVVGGLGAFLVLQLRADLGQAVDDSARTGTDTILEALSHEGSAGDEPGDPVELDESFLEAARVGLPPGSLAQVVVSGGAVELAFGSSTTSPVLSDPSLLAVSADQQRAPETVRLGDRRHRVLVTPFVDAFGASRWLVVAVSLDPVDDAVRRVLVLLLLGGPVAVGATTAATYLLTRRSLRPVEQMNAEAREIGKTQLDERIAVPEAHNEVRELALTINAMLGRIERGVVEKHRLIADASHELRTPLAVMRVELDVSLRDDTLDPSARDVMESVQEEVVRVGRAVDNLLALAAIEEGRLELLTVPVEMRSIADDAARPLSRLAGAKQVTLTVEGEGWTARADPHRMGLACTNLIENAIKFSPVGGAVRVSVWRHAGEVGVTVRDDGPGVPPEEAALLFERYYRSDGERTSALGGTGLGLAICREVAVAHGGRVWVSNRREGGSAFSLALPIWRALDTTAPAEPVQSPDPADPGVVSR